MTKVPGSAPPKRSPGIHSTATADRHLTASIQLLQAHRPDIAEEQARKALAADPDRGWAHSVLALCLFERGAEREALEEADAGVRLEPNNHDAHHVRADVLFGMGRLGDASAAAEEAVRLEPACVWGHRQRSDILLRQYRYEGALDASSTALRIDPTDTESLGSHSAALVALGRHDEAEATVRLALSRDPSRPGLVHDLGRAQMLRGDDEAAYPTYREAARLDPNQSVVVAGLEGIQRRRRSRSNDESGQRGPRAVTGAAGWWARRSWPTKTAAIAVLVVAGILMPAFWVWASIAIWMSVAMAFEPRLTRRWASTSERRLRGLALGRQGAIAIVILSTTVIAARVGITTGILFVLVGLVLFCPVVMSLARIGRERWIGAAWTGLMVALVFGTLAVTNGASPVLIAALWINIVWLSLRASTAIRTIASMIGHDPATARAG